MATIIKTNGSEEPLAVWDLEKLQTLVGGYIEGVHLEDGRLMYVNDDGKAKRLPLNQRATDLLGAPDDLVLGDVVLLTLEETQRE